MRIRPVIACAAALALLAPAGGAPGQSTQPASSQHPSLEDPRYGLLTPLPETGGVPAIYDTMYGPSAEELAFRARSRSYRKQLRLLEREYFRSTKRPDLMEQGLAELREFTDPASFRPMLEVFEDAPDGVRLAIFDHLAEQGKYGQAALAWFAIGTDRKKQPAMVNEATMRLTEALNDGPTPQPVLQVLDSALRSRKHAIANSAGALAGAINATETIPLLIFAQATDDPRPDNTGDLAWIAIQTQQAYVANVQPVVGDDAGAFQPVLGVVNEGTVLRVWDAVVVVYRTEIHQALVNMTTHEYGESTEHLGYNMKAWWSWYNNEYVPHINEQRARAELAEANAAGDVQADEDAGGGDGSDNP